MFSSAWTHRQLILLMTKRSVQAQYRGSIFGLVWAVFHPLLLLGVYTVVFTEVFSARWAGEGGVVDYAIALFSGLIVFNFFADCLANAPHLISSHLNYVKKVVFPLEILAWSAIGKSLFHFFASLAVLLAAVVFMTHRIPIQLTMLPLMLVPLVLMGIGVVWLVSSLGVYLKDVGQFVQIVILLLMFLSPIFYSLEQVPMRLAFILELNPLTPMMAQFRDVFLFGHWPSLSSVLRLTGMGALWAWAGFAWFQTTRDGFADVL
ncbi:MAG: ABC transporter permease [Acidobacteria bacterium]|nr:ABC transporter permease [Acidobacteriota bacterium]